MTLVTKEFLRKHLNLPNDTSEDAYLEQCLNAAELVVFNHLNRADKYVTACQFHYTSGVVDIVIDLEDETKKGNPWNIELFEEPIYAGNDIWLLGTCKRNTIDGAVYKRKPKDLKALLGTEGLTASIAQAILMVAADLYDKREISSDRQNHKVEIGLQALVGNEVKYDF